MVVKFKRYGILDMLYYVLKSSTCRHINNSLLVCNNLIEITNDKSTVYSLYKAIKGMEILKPSNRRATVTTSKKPVDLQGI